jgi:hypothetical protein
MTLEYGGVVIRSATVLHSTWTPFVSNPGLRRVKLLCMILALGREEKRKAGYCRVGARNVNGFGPSVGEND